MKRFFIYLMLYLFIGVFNVAAAALGTLKPIVQQELKALSVITDLPTPAFIWTLEKQRSSKGKRNLIEQFSGSINGLPDITTIETREAKESIRQRLSVRGLMDVDAKDSTLGLKLFGLMVPVTPGAKFSFELTRDNRTVTKECLARERQAAGNLHPMMTGLIVPISCTGSGSYHGVMIKSSSELAWIESLNMFLPLSEVADTPLGVFTESTRILNFELR